MFVYRRFGRRDVCYVVGFYDPKGRWYPESDYPTAQEAAERTAWLNGNKEAKEAAKEEYEAWRREHGGK